jgi:predicted DNA-binding protein (MmcQ/YjbR family)
MREILEYALSFPGAHEDFPWGESVVKVDGKVFVFLGVPREGRLGMSVKLPERATVLLERELPAGNTITPTGYGLGKSGWVSLDLLPGTLSMDELRSLIDESYVAVAKKRRIKEWKGG